MSANDQPETFGGVSEPFIRHPVATYLLMVGVLFTGIVAYPLIPVAPLPQVDFPTIQVSASYPGASPDTMASSVAQPLETQFSQIPGISQLTSSSSLGSTSITLQFDLNRDIDAAANDVQAAINAAEGQLPRNLPSPPIYRKTNPADSPIMLLSVNSDNLPITEVDNAAEILLAQQVSQISGVGQVVVGGQQKPAIRIQLDPVKMTAAGLTLEDVRTQISVTTVDSPKGTINGAQRNYTIYANDQLSAAKDWNDAIIAYRSGAPLRIRDIGQAISGPQDTQQAAWANGKRGVFLVIFKQPGANVIQVIDRIKAELPRVQVAVPPGVKVAVISDRTQTIRAALRDVQITLLITIALVVGVIFVFLRSVWATIIPAVTVPLALLGACAFMWVAGYSLDNLSLMALTVAVGFVVDDAIVMLENITRYLEEGATPFAAALRGAKEISFTIVSISISLIAVLIPLLLMSGIIGRLFREFAITLAITIAISAVVALTLTPTMASRFLVDSKHVQHGRLYVWSENIFDAILKAYEGALDSVLRHQFIMLLVFLGTVSLSAYLFVIIPKGFFPQQDTGLISGQSEASQDISFKQMMKIQEELGAIVLKDPDVATMAMSVGSGNGNALNNGRMYITLKPRDERKADASQIIARLRPQLDQVQGARLFLQAAQDVRVGGRPSRTQYQYTLQDSNLAELDTISPKVLDLLKSLPELRDVATDQQTNGTTVTLSIDRDQASRYGITTQAIDDTLYDAYGQRQVAQYFTQQSSYYVIMELSPSTQGNIQSLGSLYVKSPPTGTLVPLSAFAHWTSVPIQPLSISHLGQSAAVTISFNLAQGVSLGAATSAVQQAMEKLNAPATLIGTFQGTAQAFQDSLSSVPLLILAALVVVYLILGILYESYIHPLTILSTLPSAGVGALATLMLFHFDFSLIALIGIILLIGIVKKNGIMLVDFAIIAERDQNMEPLTAIRHAALLRFRPILMTTMAALLGGVPLMLGQGTGSEIRQPLGYAMVGGLIVSQALTLFTTPVIYLYLDRIARRFSGALQKKAKTAEDSGEGHRHNGESPQSFPAE